MKALEALNRFSVFIASFKNALGESQNISKLDQPGNMQKLLLKLWFITAWEKNGVA